MDGRLAEHFRTVAAKRLAGGEVAAAKISTQHEFNAQLSMIRMLGDANRKFPCDYVYFGTSLDGATYVKDEGLTIKYYNARKPPRPPEYRMYYPAASAAMDHAWPGDWLWICQRHDATLVVVVAQGDGAAARRLDRLFGTGLSRVGTPTDSAPAPFDLFSPNQGDDEDLDLVDADILMALGVAPRVQNLNLLDDMIRRFRGSYPLPPTKGFTAYARSVCQTADPRDDPDRALFDWVSTTNDLFFAYERHVLQPLLDAEFANREHVDVDRFFETATKYKNARFSRAGSSFEHHISALLDGVGIRHWKPRTMKDGSKPDFLFPTKAAYGDADMKQLELLTFLAAKTTTKERWRQIVTEGTKVPKRHLITLDRELNAEGLSAMKQNRVIPVLPEPIRAAYPPSLAQRMGNVRSFVDMVQKRETTAVAGGLIPGPSVG